MKQEVFVIMKNSKKHSLRGLAVLLAMTLILSMVPVTTAWAADSANFGNILGSGTTTFEWPSISGLIGRNLKPVYVTIDMGENHDELAQAVYDTWNAELDSRASGMDYSGSSVSGGVMIIAVPARSSLIGRAKPLFTKGVFETYFNGVISKAATGKKLDIQSIKDNKELLLGIADNPISAYQNAIDIPQEYVRNAAKTISGGDDFFAAWEAPITQIDLSVSVPVCGSTATTTVSKFDAKQDNRPVVITDSDMFTVVDRLGVDKYGVDLPVWSTPEVDAAAAIDGAANDVAAAGLALDNVKMSADEIKAMIQNIISRIREAYKGSTTTIEFKGGEKYIANIVLQGKLGTYFDSDTEPVLTVNGKEAALNGTNYRVLNSAFSPALLQLEIEAEHVWDEGTVTRKPTLNEDGEALFTCTVCGATKTETVSNEAVVEHYKELKAKYTPAKAKVKSVKAKCNKAAVKWNKVKGAKGYQIRLTNKKTGTYRTFRINRNNKKVMSKTVTKLAKNTKYGVKIRAYSKIEGYTFYGKWSKTKNFKTKKK